MGCLNSEGKFEHWFGNIHLSGPCNRSCYFCIGQHMMALDKENNLNSWPLPGIEEFADQCVQKGIFEINVTGTNTDPLLFRHHASLQHYLSARIEGLMLGIRTNGVGLLSKLNWWRMYTHGSISFPSFSPDIYEKMMGSRDVPPLEAILEKSHFIPKINVVLSPFLGDLFLTLDRLETLGIEMVNLREPYGQPHVGDPLSIKLKKHRDQYGMPVYRFGRMEVCYWDVHYVHVESVNLYANGRVSFDYPITRGHDDEGKVIPQSEWGSEHKRHQEQWQSWSTIRET